jgi:hypothetical protein
VLGVDNHPVMGYYSGVDNRCYPMGLIDQVVDFMWESTPDEIECDTVCYALLENDTTPRDVLNAAHKRWTDNWMDYAEFVGRLWRVCVSMGVDRDFISDTFWDMVSDRIDGGVVEGDWDFTYVDEDDDGNETLRQVDYNETYRTAEWRVMYNFGHDFHWAWRETYDGSLDEMVNYCLCRVRDDNRDAWVSQGYPDIVS